MGRTVPVYSQGDSFCSESAWMDSAYSDGDMPVNFRNCLEKYPTEEYPNVRAI